MEAAEIEIQIDELEQRVDRLRALYEQYFMGIEKLEPTIQRKDVDRRVWVLRREQIRNTGLRFLGVVPEGRASIFPEGTPTSPTVSAVLP